jgi:photosystem II stability/assembly factor-like uncharacterized protein
MFDTDPSDVWRVFLYLNGKRTQNRGPNEPQKRYTDNGRLVQRVAYANGHETAIISIAEMGSQLLAMDPSHGVFRSSDSGVNWVPVNVGLPSSLDNIGLCVVSDSTVFVGNLYRSTNRGDSWQQIVNPFPWTAQLTVASGDEAFDFHEMSAKVNLS